MTDEELADAGLFDPDRDSPRRAELLRRCLELGLTVDEIGTAGDDLVPMAIDALLGGGGEQLTLAEVAQRAGLDEETATSIAHTTGFRGHNADLRVWTTDDVASMAFIAAGRDLLGEDSLAQIFRVSAAAVGRIGDAVTSTFLTSAGATAAAEDDSGLALLEANEAGRALLDELGEWVKRSIIRYLRMSYRDLSDSEIARAIEDGIDTPVMAIGFADLVGSTSHAERRTLVDLNESIEQFEVTAVDVVTNAGGRIVKFLGDEVMFRADDPAVAAEIALALADAVKEHEALPPVRVGIAYGMVLSREADYYGPTVNLAARILRLAPMNGVVVSQETAADLAAGSGIEIDRLGAIEIQGIDHPIELASLRRPSRPR